METKPKRGRSFRGFFWREGWLEEITAYLYAIGNDPVNTEKLMMQKRGYKVNAMKSSTYCQNLLVLDNKSINSFFNQVNNAFPSSNIVAADEVFATFFKWYLTQNQNKNKYKRKQGNNDTKELLPIFHR